MQVLADDPVALIERGAPHRIHDEEALARYTKALFGLTAKPKATDAEQETIDLLTLLIEEYESRYRVPHAEPVEVLRYLMEKGGLRQQDLQKELGSLSNISMILSGQRNLTLGNAIALAARFQMDIRSLLPSPVRTPARARATASKPVRSARTGSAGERLERKTGSG